MGNGDAPYDYNFLPPRNEPQKPTTPGTVLAVENQLLVAAGLKISVKSLKTGKIHSVLQKAAQFHADYQARRGVQGHQNWNSRVKDLYKDVPECGEFKECCAESWDWNTREQAAPEMFNSWRQSPGHWSAINGRCDFWGYAMALNKKQNIWYACAIFGLLRELRA